MKKKLGLALAFALTLGISGCGSTTSKEEIVTEITQPVEITFWHAMSQQNEEALTKITNDFMDKNPKIKVTLKNQGTYTELSQKLTDTSISPESLPTISQSYSDWSYNFVQNDLLVNLDDYIIHQKIGFDNYDDILPAFREGAKIDDVTYGIPFNKSTEVMWVNQTMLKEAGITQIPQTFEELADVSKKITASKKIPGAGFDSLSNYYTTYITNKDQEYNSKFDVKSQESVEALTYYQNGIKDGSMRIAGADKYLSKAFGDEKLAIYIGSSASESFVKSVSKDKFEYAVYPYPAFKSIQQGTELVMFNSATPEQKTAAFEYMKFLVSKEQQIYWANTTGYIPVRQSAIDDPAYIKDGSKLAGVIKEATKTLYTNPIENGSKAAYDEAGKIMEEALSNPNSNIPTILDKFKMTLSSYYN